MCYKGALSAGIALVPTVIPGPAVDWLGLQIVLLRNKVDAILYDI